MRGIYRMALAAAALLSMAAPLAASTVSVSSNGTDSGSCGSNPPCASIAQAVINASAGDSIIVGPGSYAGATVNKALKLSSSSNGGANITGTVTLASDGIVFGKKGKGFLLAPGSGSAAVVVGANGVTVRGNFFSRCNQGIDSYGNDIVVRDNSFDNCSVGVVINGSGAQVRGNRTSYMGLRGMALAVSSSDAVVSENRFTGGTIAIDVAGAGHLLRRNLMQGSISAVVSNGAPGNITVQENLVVGALSLGYQVSNGSGWLFVGNAAVGGNAPGFYLTTTSPSTLIGNIANGNVNAGIYISGATGAELQGNTAIHNSIDGIVLSYVGTGVTISGGNVYGNATCGVNNSSPSSTLTIDKVYWGAPTGPGADPADDICGNTALITVTNPAAKAGKIKLPSVK